MAQIDTFGSYVRHRLDHWGEVFCLARDCDYLGHSSKNILQVLIDHKGDMPERSNGRKPLTVDDEAMAIEIIVTDIARTDRSMACVLRAYYCGSGRKKVERWETSNLLITNAGLPMVSLRQYQFLSDLGFERIRGRLEGLACVD